MMKSVGSAFGIFQNVILDLRACISVAKGRAKQNLMKSVGWVRGISQKYFADLRACMLCYGNAMQKNF